MTSASPRRKGSLHRGLVADRAVRFLAVELAGLANETRERHGLGPTAAHLAAEALVAATLMSAWVKGRERITLQIQAESPRFAFMADVDAEGGIRARMTPARVKVPEDGALHGLLYAIRADVKKEIYRGVSALDGQSLEAALARHVKGSEQMNALLRIGVVQDETGRVQSAAGMLLERLPEEPGLPSIDAETFATTFDSIQSTPAQELLIGLAFGAIVGHKVEILENRDLHWRCGCGQERIEAVLVSLGETELQAIIDEQGAAEVSCHFCNVAYRVDRARLEELVALVRGA
jgi:molecular chaperone Hsp33